MSNEPGEYYTEDRWQNWIDRLREEEIDLEAEDSWRLLWNLQDDTAIAVAKILTAFDDGTLDDEAALDEIEDMQEIVLSEVAFEAEEKTMLIDSAQTSLMCVFHAASEYILGGPAEEGTIEEYIRAAADAEADQEMDAALGYCVQAATLVIDGHEMDEEMEIDGNDDAVGLVDDWINGIASLQTALRDPEVVEEDED